MLILENYSTNFSLLVEVTVAKKIGKPPRQTKFSDWKHNHGQGVQFNWESKIGKIGNESVLSGVSSFSPYLRQSQNLMKFLIKKQTTLKVVLKRV